MAQINDIWIPESIFENNYFWKLSPLKYRILLSCYEEFPESIPILYKRICYIGKRRTVTMDNLKSSLKGLKGFFFDDDMNLVYKNRMGKAEFIKTNKASGKPDALIRENWTSYVRNTDNPIRMRRETYDFIMNNSLTPLQMKCILYILRAYKSQKTKEYTRRYVEIAKIFGMNTRDGGYVNDIRNAMTYILININNGFLKDFHDIKLSGHRGLALKIVIRREEENERV